MTIPYLEVDMKDTSKTTHALMILACGWIVGSFSAAHANEIKGTWKLHRQECLSGAPFNQFSIDKLDMIILIDKSQMQSNIKLEFRHSPQEASQNRAQLQEALATWATLPDSAEKRQAISEINDLLRMMELYATGIKCESRQRLSYKINGSKMLTTTEQSSTDCPGADAPTGETTSSTLSFINSNTLRVTSDEAETSDDSSCPKGDRIVTVLKRVK